LCKYYFKTVFGFERCKKDTINLNHAEVYPLCDEMKKGRCGKKANLFETA